jgi:GT2 family glycosyltransferase
MTKLSIIIVSYNTKDLTLKTIRLLLLNLKKEKFSYEIIIIDNNSSDNSINAIEEIKKQNQNIILIKNKQNFGYSKANNQGIKKAKGEYILFLNSDVLATRVNFSEILDYLDKNPDVGGLTVKVLLDNNQLDWACHRGFPTLWNSFCYFLRLEKIFSHIPLINKIFGGYHLMGKNINQIHEIDSPSGAFFLTRKNVLKKIGGFDENFFMYGEDLDLAFRIKKLGYKIIFYPKCEVLHLKYASGLKKNNKITKIKTKKSFYQAMKIFYDKHYQKKYPVLINKLVHLIIDFKIKKLKA